jgi:hypothetical protein
MPTQHLHDPLVVDQVEPEALGLPPLPSQPCALGLGLLAPRSPAFGRLRTRGDVGTINSQHQNGPPWLTHRDGRNRGEDLLPAGGDIQHRQPLGDCLSHLVGGVGTQRQPRQLLEQLTRGLVRHLLGQVDGGLVDVGLLAAPCQLQRLVQRDGAELAALTVKVWVPESDRPHQRLDGTLLWAAGRQHLPTSRASCHPLLHQRPMRFFHQARRHRLCQLLPEGKHGLGQLLQGRLGFLHMRL